MILFLNFAPIDFMGGAERWMLQTATAIHKKEPSVIVHVDRSISNIYAQIVLKRKFESRVVFGKNSTLPHIKAIGLTDFLPFTKKWNETRNLFLNARHIYLRFEILECFILFYFGGIASFKKAIAGIHSAYNYISPESFFDHLHNFVYQSAVCRSLLRRFKTVHVLTKRDQQFFRSTFNLVNTELVPNSTVIPSIQFSHNTNLQIVFVGELTRKKGCDILLSVLKLLPPDYTVSIAGNGPMIDEVQEVVRMSKNSTYYGYLSKQQLEKIFKKSDVLFLPSRAETLPTVILEAMSYGLKIVDSKEVGISLPSFIEYTNIENTIEKYIEIFNSLAAEAKKKDYIKQKKLIHDYAKSNFSRELITKKLQKLFFQRKS